MIPSTEQNTGVKNMNTEMNYEMTAEEAEAGFLSMYCRDVAPEGDIMVMPKGIGHWVETAGNDEPTEPTPTGTRQRKAGGGRKGEVVVHNLPEIDAKKLPLWFDDAMNGVVNAFAEEKKNNQAYVDMTKVACILNHSNDITTKMIQELTGCGRTHAFRFMKTIKMLVLLAKPNDIEYIDTTITNRKGKDTTGLWNNI